MRVDCWLIFLRPQCVKSDHFGVDFVWEKACIYIMIHVHLQNRCRWLKSSHLEAIVMSCLSCVVNIMVADLCMTQKRARALVASQPWYPILVLNAFVLQMMSRETQNNIQETNKILESKILKTWLIHSIIGIGHQGRCSIDRVPTNRPWTFQYGWIITCQVKCGMKLLTKPR